MTISNILKVIKEAQLVIPKYFPTANLELVIKTDPEYKNEHFGLVIITDLKPELAYLKLKELDHDWWLEQYALIGKDLNIYLEFSL